MFDSRFGWFDRRFDSRFGWFDSRFRFNCGVLRPGDDIRLAARGVNERRDAAH